MFIDKVQIEIQSGKGGDGAIAFHREKYVPNGGPDGGDGGKGGDIILKSTRNQHTLSAFRYQRKFKAQNGQDGAGNKRSGKNAPDLYIEVPVGCMVTDAADGRILFDFTEEHQTFIAAKGGRGGNGNQHYATSTRQSPAFAKRGDEGETKRLLLELKTIADVGLVGFPNAGKSTLLSALSAAKPKIASYPFTTLQPNLGVVRHKNAEEFILVDIPGLIEGASQGAGLGREFLRHVERTRLLIHVIDAASTEGRDPKEDYAVITNELSQYPTLMEKPRIVFLNKTDLIAQGSPQDDLAALKAWFEAQHIPVFTGSGAAKQGLDSLLDFVTKRLPTLPVPVLHETPPIPITLSQPDTPPFTIEKQDGILRVQGPMIRRLLSSINLSDYESRTYFDRVLRLKGVYRALEEQGLKSGDTIDFEGFLFTYEL